MQTKILVAAMLLAAGATNAQAVGRLADVVIIDRSTGRELPVHWHEGKAYVVGKPGSEYKIRLRNRHGEDLLAVVSVDGVNAVSGQTAGLQQSGYVLSPWGRTEIRGWRKSLDETASFYFTSLGDSYAGRTGRPDNVGVIGVALFERARPITAPFESWQPPSMDRYERHAPQAQAESAVPAPRAKSHSPGAPLGTGHGRREDSHAHQVEFERASRHPAEVVTIHYDSYPNLVAMGVIPPRYGRRAPDPFPMAFTPDPPRYRW